MDKKVGEYQDFLSKNFCLTVPKIFVGEPFSVSLISGIEKVYSSENYVTIFLPEFFVSQHRNISQKNPSVLCFRKFLVAKKFMDKSEGEVSRFPSKIFCLTLPKTFVGEPFSVSLISGIENFSASENYFTIFLPEFFVSQHRNISQKNPSVLCFRKFLVAKKFMDKSEGEVSRFPSKIFCLTLPKTFVGEPFSVSLISGIEKVYSSENYVTIFLPEFFVSQHRNISKKNPSVLCFRKILVAKKFMDKSEGEVSRFPSKIFCLTLPKTSVGQLL